VGTSISVVVVERPVQCVREALGFLRRPDFGSNPVADVRDPA